MPRPDAAVARSGGGSLLGGLVTLAGLLIARPIVRRLFGRRPPRQPRVDSRAVAVGHETRDVRVGWVVLGVVVLVLGIGLAVGTATLFQTARVRQPLTLNPAPGLATPVVPPPPPEPRLEEEPGAQLRQLRAAEDQILNSVGWVDRQSGVAHIPIDRAVDLLSANPPPARSVEEASQYQNDASTLPSDASSGRSPSQSGSRGQP